MPGEGNPVTNASVRLPPALAPTTPQVITERIRGLIHRGELGPGDRLPPERALADQLVVARVSLREALAQLQREGYIVARRGALGGTFVTELVEPRRRWLHRMRENLADFEDIIDYRIAVEAYTVGLAARRRHEGDLQAIQDAVRQLPDVTDILSFRAADSAFHRAIAAAARSPRLAAGIDEARGELFPPADALVYPLDIDAALRDHARIAAAVRDGDEARATAAMREHIESTRSWLRGILSMPDAANVGDASAG
jgi:DNA-binding FadR family transcriptional regulator